MATFYWLEADGDEDIRGWDAQQWEKLVVRYNNADGAQGVARWRDFVLDVQRSAAQPQTDEWRAALESTLDEFVNALRTLPAPEQKTVFVSHQRGDAHLAEWVAWAATEAHLDYWLDVHDPPLAKANAALLPPPVKSVLIAGIIEMALLNCTHIISMQTSNAQKSRWVPYEFARAKERRLIATNAASWFKSGIAPDANGDYLWLAFCAPTWQLLQGWLNHAGRTPPPRPNLRWKRPVPTQLPN